MAVRGHSLCSTAREHEMAEDKEIDRRFYKVFGNIKKNQSITLGEEKISGKQWYKTFQPFAKPIEIEPVLKLWVICTGTIGV